MILQIFVILAFLAIGELVVEATGLPISSGIIGMILLTMSLKAGVVKLEWVEQGAEALVGNLGFFFIPAAVGLMQCLDIVSQEIVPIAVAAVVSTIFVIAATGHIHQGISRIKIPERYASIIN